MYILGISALYHDSAAAIIKDGEILAASQEERYTRIKHDKSFPINAIRYCMNYAKITEKDLEAVVYYDDPIFTIDRFLYNASAAEDCEEALNSAWESLFREKIWVSDLVKKTLGGFGRKGSLLYAKHHMSHAASAFYPSPFEKAAIITLDGVGEWNTTTIGEGNGNRVRLYKKIDYPNSLGLLYSAFTYFCGFRVNYGDYKLMGLAPYGIPRYYELIKDKLIDIKEDGSFRLNMEFFDFQNGKRMTNQKFAELFGGGEARNSNSDITKREMDMASSVQKVVEEVVIKLAKTASEITNQNDNLVMAGGVALNCVANGELVKNRIFKNIWIQPAAGDAGGALGAALLTYYDQFRKKRIVEKNDSQKGSFLGDGFEENEIEDFLKKHGFPYHKFTFNDAFFSEIARNLNEQKVIGLFEGRMEFGPRALGHRSIIADPRSAGMQSHLNKSIKYRESFRPFAPAVLEEDLDKYFEIGINNSYMLFCGKVKGGIDDGEYIQNYLESSNDLIPIINRKRSILPAITHVDNSARIQTVNYIQNPIFYNIIRTFKEKYSCGVVINTSFNVRGEPIVRSIDDAYRCFMETEMDVLVLENYILYKQEQPEWNCERSYYEPD